MGECCWHQHLSWCRQHIPIQDKSWSTTSLHIYSDILPIKNQLQFESTTLKVSVAMSPRDLGGKYCCRLHPMSWKCACHDFCVVDPVVYLKAKCLSHTLLSSANSRFYTIMICIYIWHFSSEATIYIWHLSSEANPTVPPPPPPPNSTVGPSKIVGLIQYCVVYKAAYTFQTYQENCVRQLLRQTLRQLWLHLTYSPVNKWFRLENIVTKVPQWIYIL